MDIEYPPSTGYQPGSPRERLISSVLSFGIILLVILGVIFSGTVLPEAIKAKRFVGFTMDAPDPNKSTKTSEASPKAPHVATRAGKPALTQPKPLIAIQKKVEKRDALDDIPGFISLSKSDLAAADIGKMTGSAKGSDSNGKGSGARTAQGPGDGPGGVKLYDAQWHRRPTDAELSTYMPRNGALSGWGLIACRTVERYRVEDCQILGESPRGSGFGRAVQNAAWQFLVKPPRIDNKPQIGEWVRIRIDYTSTPARTRTDSSSESE